MQYKQLGKSELYISEIGFGCMSLGADHNSNAQLLFHALDRGINFFDTADLYQQGLNEETIGKAFKGVREKVILATKVGNQWRSDGSGWDWNPRKSYIIEAIEHSLRRLQTSYVDLYQLHGGTIQDPIDETIDAFETLKKQGKIRYYGISSIRPNVIREYVRRSSIVSVMMQYSLLDRRPEEECLDLLYKNNIGVLVRGSLASGLLINKPVKNYLNHNADQVARAADAIRMVAGNKRSVTETAIRFVLHHDAITSAIVGIRTMEQLKECIQAGRSAALHEHEVEALRHSIEENQYQEHR